MKRAAKIIAAFLGSVVLFVVAAVLVLSNTDWGRERVRRVVLSVLEGPVHGQVEIGRIDGNLLKGAILHDVAIRDSAGNPFLAVEEARVGYGLGDLARQRIYLSDIRLVQPEIVLDQPPGGEWNFARIFPGDTTQQDTSSGPGFGSWITLRDVEVVSGQVIVRTPWAPDSTLAPAARDSAVAVALSDSSRARIVRVPAGFQQMIELRELYADLPLVRLADPEQVAMRVESDSLRMTALPFKPPAAEIRQLRGAFELTGDSAWFRDARLRMPGSEAVLSGKLAFGDGRTVLEARARPIALADLRFAYPALPSEGGGNLEVGVLLDSASQRVAARGIDVRTGTATLAGDLGMVIATDTFGFYDTSLRFAGVDTRLIEQLVPGLEVPRRGLLGGRATLDGGLRALALDADVTFDDATAGRSRVVAQGGIGLDSSVFSARSLRVTLDPVQVALVRVAVRDLPVAGTLTGTVTVDGSTATRLITVADLTHRDRGALSRIAGRVGVGLGATTAVDADVRLLPLSLVTAGRFAPAVGLRGAATGPVRVSGTLRDLALDARLRFTDGGGLTARGRMDVESAEKSYDLYVGTELFNANTLVATAPRTSLTAVATARGRGIDPATMRAAFALDAQASTYDSLVVDTARVRVDVAAGLARLDTLLVRAPNTLVEAGGSFGLAEGQSGELAYRVAVDSLSAFARFLPRDTGVVAARPAVVGAAVERPRRDSLLEFQRTGVARAATGAPPVRLVVDTPSVRRDTLAGALYAAGIARGGIEGFDLRGRFGARNVLALGNTVRELRAEYAWVNALRPGAALVVGAQVDSASAAGFALDSLDVRATYRFPARAGGRAVGMAQLFVFQDDSSEFGVNAEYALDNRRSEVTLRDVRLRLDQTLWTSTHPGVIGWGGDGIDVDSVELRNPVGGRIYANGRIPNEGAADFDVAIENFEVADAIGLAQGDLEASGLVSLGARLRGTARAPRLDGELRADSLNYGGTPLPDLRASFAYDDVRLTARAEAVRAGRQPLLVATGEVPINLALQGVTGSRFPGRPTTIDVALDSLPLDLIPEFTDAVANVRGAASGSLAVRGTLPDQLTFNGQLAIGDARMRVVPAGITLDDLAVAVRFDGDSVVVDSIAARSGGPIRIEGGVGIKTPSEPAFDLRLVANDAVVLNNERGRVHADAQLSLYGPFERVFASGGVRVRQGVIYIPAGGRDPIALSSDDPAVVAVVDDTAAAKEAQLIAAQSPLLKNLRARVNLRVDRDTWVRNANANVEIYSQGDLVIDVDQQAGALTLEGVMASERGEYAFLSRRFQIERGLATFTGTPEINPLLQATAQVEVEQPGGQPFFIRLLIGGTALNPTLNLESTRQPPLSQSDLLAYLAFSRSSSSLLAGGNNASLGSGGSGGPVGAAAALVRNQLAGVALGVAVNSLEANLARSLGADVLVISPAELPAGLTNVGGFLLSSEVEYGKYLNTRSFLGLNVRPQVLDVFTTDATGKRGFRQAPPGIRYQYELPRGLRLETTFEPRYRLSTPTLSAQTANTWPVFGAFLRREWRF